PPRHAEEKEAPGGWSKMGIVHTNVALMAGRVCMDKLGRLAIHKLSSGMLNSHMPGVNPEEATWNIDNVVKIVDRVYTCTSEPEDNGGSVVEQKDETAQSTPQFTFGKSKSPQKDNVKSGHALLRNTVVQFCAWKIDRFSVKEGFIDMCKDHPDFMASVLRTVNCGRQVEIIGRSC